MIQTFSYSAFGLRIVSEIELPELPHETGEPEVIFRWGHVPAGQQKANDDVHVMFNGIAGRFLMNAGREIVVDALPEADMQAVRLVLLGKAMAALLRQRGWLPLHSSGIAVDGRAVLFLGPSGAGKSTAAAALHARGHSIVTDDVGAVKTRSGVCRVRSAPSRLRLSNVSLPLLNGSYDAPVLQVDKFALTIHQRRLPQTLPVARVYILDFGPDLGSGDLRVQPLPPLLAAASLSTHSFFRPRDFETQAVRSHLQECAAMAEVIRIVQVVRGRTLDSLPGLVRLVEADLSEG